MPALTTPVCDFGAPAVHFALPGVDHRSWSLADCTGENGLLVMFLCNHCPYVQSILSNLVEDCQKLTEIGIGCVAISANDVDSYPDDSFDNMQRIASEYHFSFPYLYDASQQTAKEYGAVCTPDFFGYAKDGGLQYRGRFDDRGKSSAGVSNRELFTAMSAIAHFGKGPKEQIPSIGCSIKWRLPH